VEVESAPVEQQESEPVMTERVKAEVGVGKKGRSLDQYDKGVERVIAQPARMLFATEQKMVFEVQIPQAMQLFEALEGRAPTSHEEFMSKIIQSNNIQLPQLPEGQKYIYDPQTKQLMVERPVQ
jgi:hypothetical protein